ncbi:Uncharacterized protein dnl_48230 [Desulfonema limicola]|uniref:Uncharacterized protein n=2 Tax=Desulfonema limicola TaxID=45656 RepID=A0A975BBR2_9BACT|nr:Uncharacterized protein dnl_48230 [Desulfonema limicola]
MELPEDIEKQFQDELIVIKEEKKMAYVTSIERLAKKEMILEAISTRFKSVPEDIASFINNIKAADKLKAIFRQAITCESLDDFREILKTAD